MVVNRLRERLAPGAGLLGEAGSYRLVVDPAALDATLFKQLVGQAGDAVAERPGRAAETLTTALDLWRGEPFQPFGSSPGLRGAATHLAEQRRDAEELLLDALLADDRPGAAATWATVFVETEPYRERRWEQLMLALYRTGRQAEALQTGRRAAAVLREDLGLEPGPGLLRLEADVLAQAPSLDAPGTAPRQPAAAPRSRRRRAGRTSPQAVPQREEPLSVAGLLAGFDALVEPLPRPGTSFVGREAEQARLAELTDRSRLVTVLGPPGAGKTRLAAEHATATTDRRVVWIDLVPLDGSGMVATLAARLGVRIDTGTDLATAVGELCAGPTLVVLDNAEHLLGPVAELATRLLAACPSLIVVVTSRTALGVAEETRLTLGPLAADAALTLLVERSGRHPGTADERRHLARLVAGLDGLPLALELAAPALATIPPGELLAQLGSVLAGSGRADHRHSSLAAAVDWSLGMLTEPDRALFAQLGVLSGSYRSRQVSDVCGIPLPEARAGLNRLAAAGLLRAEHGTGGDTRWRQLNVVRARSRAELERTGTLDRAVRNHVRHHLDLVQRAVVDLVGPAEPTAVATLAKVGDQLLPTHQHLLRTGDAAASAAFTLGLWEHTFFRQHFHRYRWLEDTLAVPGVDRFDRFDELLAQAALAAWARDRHVESVALAARAEAAASARGHPVPLAALKSRFNVAAHERDVVRAGRLLSRLISESTSRADARHHSDNLVVAGLGFAQLGLVGQARRMAGKALALAEGTGNPTSVAWAQVGIAATQVSRDPAAAAQSFASSARLATSVRNRWVHGTAMAGLDHRAASAGPHRGGPAAADRRRLAVGTGQGRRSAVAGVSGGGSAARGCRRLARGRPGVRPARPGRPPLSAAARRP
ncbi:MAG: ATP-binding protein [Pseudonocardia sp.]